VLVYNGRFIIEGYIRSNGCFRNRISQDKFIIFKSFFLKGLLISGLSLVILNSIYVAYRDLGIVTNLWGVSGVIKIEEKTSRWLR
jgi:hypothetical protein